MYRSDIIKILLTQQNRSLAELAKFVTGNSRSPLTNLFKEGANPTASTLEKVADFLLVAVDTFFVRETKLPEAPRVWMFDNRAEYYERGMVAKDGIIQAMDFDRQTMASLLEMQREAIANLEDLNAQLKEILKEHNIPIPRPKPKKHPVKETYIYK